MKCVHNTTRVMNAFQQFLAVLALLLAPVLAHAASYQYFRLGNKTDAQTKPDAGIAMMGGGTDLDEAFRWLCHKTNGGDFLVLRATGDDDYNSYVKNLCPLNSAATLIIPDRQAAQDPAVAEIIRHAEAIFIAGGDQAVIDQSEALARGRKRRKPAPVPDAVDEGHDVCGPFLK